MAPFTKLTRITLWLIAAAATGTALVLSSAYLYLSPKLPPVDVLRDVQLQTPLRIYSADDQLIGEFGEKRRTPIEFEQIPPLFVDALLSAEDDGFYSHHGVDIKGLLRAASQLLLTGSIQTGGSTITMQVAKNYFLSMERTFSRKFNEILLALQIERELTKNDIIELYLNKIFFGNRAYGVQAAAQVYYGKPIAELNLAQFAMIAGLPKAPSSFNPLVNPERALQRRDWILDRMLNLGYIDQLAHDEAVNSPVTARYHGSTVSVDAPHIAEMVRVDMLNRFGSNAYTDGYSVYTTVNAHYQKAARQAVIDGLSAYDERHGYRGPEGNFLEPGLDEEAQRQQWLKVLAQQVTPARLMPAIVALVHEQAFTALLADGSSVLVDWNHLKEMRRYETVDRRGALPKVAADLVNIGDLVRLKQAQDGSWLLTQVPAAQAALVSLNADDGAILSLVGGFDFQLSKYNRITQATRQPGSNFKPFIYTAALANGYTPATIINDAPIVFEDASLESTWRPTNDSGKFYGPTRLRYALFKSRNLVSIRLLRGLGIPEAIAYTQRFGFDTAQLPRDLSLALGSHSLSPLSIVTGYAVLANGGYSVQPYLLARIDNLAGETIYQARPNTVCRPCEEEAEAAPAADAGSESEAPQEELATIEDVLNQDDAEATEPEEEPLPEAQRVIEPRVAYIMDSMLRDVVKKGTGRRARTLERNDLAGKTGTTNGPTDAWFSGYGGGVVTTAWLGFDKNGVLGRREYGGSAALPIWIEYMRVALQGREEIHRKQPPGIVTVKIDPTTGLLARPGQSDAIFEIFREELAPTQQAEEASVPGDTSIVEETSPQEEIF